METKIISEKRALSSFFGALGEEAAHAIKDDMMEMRKKHRETHANKKIKKVLEY